MTKLKSSACAKKVHSDWSRLWVIDCTSTTFQSSKYQCWRVKLKPLPPVPKNKFHHLWISFIPIFDLLSKCGYHFGINFDKKKSCLLYVEAQLECERNSMNFRFLSQLVIQCVENTKKWKMLYERTDYRLFNRKSLPKTNLLFCTDTYFTKI